MSGMAGLIDRLEKATGPDRGLDAAVAMAAGWTPPRESGSCGPLYPGRDDFEWHDEDGVARGFSPPALTASIDAAVALVERCLPGWSWECRKSGTGDKGQATVWNPQKAPGRNGEQRAYNCPSPAIALLLALLRALSEDKT